MNAFRSLCFLRALVFLLTVLVLHDTIIAQDPPASPSSKSLSQVVVMSVDEQGSDDWEGRFFGLEQTLCKGPVYEIELVIPFTVVKINFSNATSHFKSVPSELPSPPPRG
jgi:hypothetical protein